MLNLQDLYQEVILDHNRNPRNFHTMEDATQQQQGFNPLCGDKLSLYLNIENDIIIDASFVGHGCAISTASASLMTDAIKGKTVAEAKAMFDSFHQAVVEDNTDAEKQLGKLAVLTGVKQFPSRVKCATLAWHTLQAAMEDSDKVVTTE